MNDTTARRLMMSMTIIEAALDCAQEAIDQERATIRELIDRERAATAAKRRKPRNHCGPTVPGDERE